MKYRFLLLAQIDVIDAIEWYDSRRAGLGDQFADEMDGFITRILRLPRMFARVKRGVQCREFREGMLNVFPFRVVYEVTANEIVIYSVTHARSIRQPWRRRLP
ncbi:MAG: type II toxin-antitoxin system RelE/ParE family toxin [Planctomycetia bacterium]|nr:type II toxin-antitoxin system RelE/ParE family toxin [Planctomycetia bacterium]